MLVALVAVFAALFVACGGGDDPAYKAGPLACDGMGKKSYHYTMNVVEEKKDVPPVAPATPDPNSIPVTVSFAIQGAIEGGGNGGSFDSKQHNEVTGGSGDIEIIHMENGTQYYNAGQGWIEAVDPRQQVNLAFHPTAVCEALSPDADTTKLGDGVPETINGVPSLKFTFTDLPSEFAKREPDLGGGGDAGSYIKSVDGTVWVAEKGNLITKLKLSGIGEYTDEPKTIGFTLDFEMSDLGSDINVSKPSLPTP